MSINRMKWSVCNESPSSSSEDDVYPILPETSSGELSPIEESHLEDGIDSDSSTSQYMSSFCHDSLSNISSMSGDDQRKVSSQTNKTTEDCEQNSDIHSQDDIIDYVIDLDIGSASNISAYPNRDLTVR